MKELSTLMKLNQLLGYAHEAIAVARELGKELETYPGFGRLARILKGAAFADLEKNVSLFRHKTAFHLDQRNSAGPKFLTALTFEGNCELLRFDENGRVIHSPITSAVDVNFVLKALGVDIDNDKAANQALDRIYMSAIKETVKIWTAFENLADQLLFDVRADNPTRFIVETFTA